MKLENSFTVPVPRADAWKVLLDVERVAPCMPGATLTSRDGDAFTGTVKVKVGPINLTYRGQARFVSLDEAAGVAVIEGSGKETRGTGTATATITCRLSESGSSTRVDVETDLAVTGKPAQFGRGVLADVSSTLVDRFAAALSEEIQAGQQPPPESSEATSAAPVGGGAGPAFSIGEGEGPAEQAAADGAARPAPAPANARAPRESEPIDLVGTAGLPVLKAAGPAVGALAGLLLAYLLGWRRGACAVAQAARD